MNLYLGVDVRDVSREQAAQIKQMVSVAVRSVIGREPTEVKDTPSEVTGTKREG